MTTFSKVTSGSMLAFQQCVGQGQLLPWREIQPQQSFYFYFFSLGNALFIHFLSVPCLKGSSAQSSTRPSTTAEEEEPHCACLLRRPAATTTSDPSTLLLELQSRKTSKAVKRVRKDNPAASISYIPGNSKPSFAPRSLQL